MDDEGRQTLDYAPARRDSAPFDWRKVLWLGVAVCAPAIACYAWARLSVDWLIRQSWWRSGQPFEGIYEPRFIRWPWIVCTVLLALEGLFVVVMVVRRRWSGPWLTFFPAAVVVWTIFSVMMALLDDNVFP